MNRREETEKEAFNYINSNAVSPENMQLAFGDFINGAKWADKTMIDKACEWLIEKIDEDVLIKCGSVIKCIDAVEFSEYFRKAMLEGE